MKKSIKKAKPKLRRHIEDAPFYQFKYDRDDLPLDPAKSFILEEISKPHDFIIFIEFKKTSCSRTPKTSKSQTVP